MSFDRVVSAHRAMPTEAASREIPSTAKCGKCGSKIADHDVALRIAVGGGVKPIYIHNRCVTGMLSDAAGVDDPVFERKREEIAAKIRAEKLAG